MFETEEKIKKILDDLLAKLDLKTMLIDLYWSTQPSEFVDVYPSPPSPPPSSPSL